MKSSVAPGYEEALEAARYLQKRWRERPRIGITLGSGLGEVARRLRQTIAIPYKRIPYFPQPTVPGHSGILRMGFWGGVPVAVLEGRLHLYEGYTPAEVVFSTRVLGLAGIKILLITCAAGGIKPNGTPGSLMVISDHLNLQGSNPLAGLHDPRWGTGFIDMSAAYDHELGGMARRAAAALRLKCFAGVYAALLGPSFETPAEICALRRLGADAVGMSAVPEALAARQLGLRVLGIAAITNRAAGLSRKPLTHEEVLEVGERAAPNLVRLLDTLLPEIAESCGDVRQ